MISDGELTCKTINIIEDGGRIYLRRKDRMYLHSWTNIAAGPDNAVWGVRKDALEFFSLKWALTIAPLYKCKVVVIYPNQRKSKS